MLTIVMYHYVRDYGSTTYPRLKGLDRKAFIGQLDYLERHYEQVSMDQIIAAWMGQEELPKNACHLTFDDGLIDHYEVAFPLLFDRGWKASFFPIAQTCLEHTVADVHKIHHVLASIEKPKQLYVEILNLLDKLRTEHHLESNEAYKNRFLVTNRVGDEPEVNFIKRILQKGLPEYTRKIIIDNLFRHHVSNDEAAFSSEIYVSFQQLNQMLDEQMNIGSHGWSHKWLAEISDHEVHMEIHKSRDFLVELGVTKNRWTISYPYGSVNDHVISCARSAGAILGLTSVFDLADPRRDTIFRVPRLDTNHVPRNPHAERFIWNAVS